MKPQRKVNPRAPGAETRDAPGLKIYWVQSFIFLALMLFVASVLGVTYWLIRDNAAEHRQLADGARIMALAIESELDLVRKRLQSLGGDERLREVVLAGHAQDIEAEEVALAQRLPSAMHVLLMLPEQTTTPDGRARLSYAGLDLVRRAIQDGRVTSIEVHRVGQPDMHLAVAAPVFGSRGEKVVGAVYVASPLALLPDPSKGVDTGGVLRYQQLAGDKATTLAVGGQHPARAPDHVEPLPGTSLRLAAWVASPGLVEWLPLLVVFGAFLVLVALTGLILWLGYRGLSRDLEADFTGIRSLFDDVVHNRPLRKVVSRLSETQVIYQEVLAFLRAVDTGRAGAPRGPAPLRSEPEQEPELSDEVEELVGPSSYVNEHSVEVAEIDLESEYGAAYSDQLGAFAASAASENPLESFDIGHPESAEAVAAEDAFAVDAEIGAEAATALVPGAAVGADGGISAVYRAYDIRGLVGPQIDEELVQSIGRALASEALERGDPRLVVGRDNRSSSPKLCAALIAGARAAGMDVVDLGVVPTPLVYFACSHPDPSAGAMVTASHNPAEYNGVKPVLNGRSADAATIQVLRQRVESGDFATGDGAYHSEDVVADYRSYVEHDVAVVRALKVVIDCGNATPSAVAPELYRAIGCEVIDQDCDLAEGIGDATSDPAQPEACRALAERVRAEGADVGLAFDADGDRLGVVDSEGQYIAADRVLMVLAEDLLTRHPGSDVIFDVKCTRYLADQVRQAGGRPIMWTSGHAPLKAKLAETGAILAGELSGHIIFGERWFGFDDAVYAGARLLEVLSLDPRPSHEIFAALPGGMATPELELPLQEGEAQRVMAEVMRLADRLDGVEVIPIDGLRAEFDLGWGLVRASNTQPKLTFRFEGEDEASLEKIKSLFRRLMAKAAPELELPF